MNPFRINEVDLEIEVYDTDTEIDPDYGHPINEKVRSIVIIPGQLRFQQGMGAFSNLKVTSRTLAGDKAQSVARVIFKASRLADAGVTIKKGDKIKSVVGDSNVQDLNLVINEVRPESILRGPMGSGRARYIFCEWVEDKDDTASI